MNMLVTAPVAAAAVAAPSIAEAASPDRSSAAAMLQRAEHVIEALRTRHVCDGWSIDDAAAEQALAFFRKAVVDPGAEDDASFEAMNRFCASHGQSLDWIIRGDPSGMICGLAARSARARSASDADDPIFAAIAKYRAALATHEAVLERKSEYEAKCFAKGRKPRRRLETELRRGLDAERAAACELADTIPTTPAGLIAVLELVQQDEFTVGWMADEDFRSSLLASIQSAAVRVFARA